MNKSTAAELKILLQFKRFTETTPFKEEIVSIRKKIGIPLNGEVLTSKQKKNIWKYIKNSEPDEHRFTAKGYGFECISKYPKAVKKILSMFPMMTPYFELILRNYIYYNIFLYDELNEKNLHSLGICEINDAEEEETIYLMDDDPENYISIGSNNKRIIDKIYKYPVSIRIHPDASQRDIVEFIRKNHKKIVVLQGKYKNTHEAYTLKNSRTKENIVTKRRNAFIYNNRLLPKKKLMVLLYGKYGDDFNMDYSTINKVISMEKKRRKDL